MNAILETQYHKGPTQRPSIEVVALQASQISWLWTFLDICRKTMERQKRSRPASTALNVKEVYRAKSRNKYNADYDEGLYMEPRQRSASTAARSWMSKVRGGNLATDGQVAGKIPEG